LEVFRLVQEFVGIQLEFLLKNAIMEKKLDVQITVILILVILVVEHLELFQLVRLLVETTS
jgi:hypothetical protein